MPSKSDPLGLSESRGPESVYQARDEADRMNIARPAKGFGEDRAHLKSMAYGLLESLSEANDAATSRGYGSAALARTDPEPRGWLTTLVVRFFLDMLEVPIKHPREENLEERFPGPCEALFPDSICPELLVSCAGRRRRGNWPAAHAVGLEEATTVPADDADRL